MTEKTREKEQDALKADIASLRKEMAALATGVKKLAETKAAEPHAEGEHETTQLGFPAHSEQDPGVWADFQHKLNEAWPRTMSVITTILDIGTALLHLVEGEGRILRRSVMRLGWAVAFIAAASLLVLAAARFFLLCIYQYLASQMSPAAAALLVSLLAFVLTLIFAGLAKWQTR